MSERGEIHLADQRQGALKGRGTPANPKVRFERTNREAFDDGWDLPEDTPPPQTTLIPDATRSIIARNDSPDIGFDRSINPYRGCEHGCVYCFARPSHAYLGFSPGLDFETKIVFKPQAPALLEQALGKPGYTARPIMLGSNTDPYQPVERRLQITRGILEVLERCNHPLVIVTKSAGVLRDADILARMARRNLVRVFLSVTTLNPGLARAMEPRAASPARRLDAIARLTQDGVPTGVMAAPMIPGLNDMEMERILAAAARAGALAAGFTLLRLPLETGELFTEWLKIHVPERAQHVLSLIRQMRGGRLNEADFHARFTGQGPYAAMLNQRFARAARQYGFAHDKPGLDISRFIPPSGPERQLSLF